MRDKNNLDQPYELLGIELKKLRDRRHETIIEVSGAVEIDGEELTKFESGLVRPSEDILALLISYFGIKESESNKLWSLAGYDYGTNELNTNGDEMQLQSQPVILLPMDARVVYTDQVHVVINNYGVVINFMQGGSNNTQPLAVSRVGMSKDHAYSLLEVLKNTLEESSKPKEIKQLPSTTKPKKPLNKKKKEKEA